jgi:hypothetical protein
MEDQAVRIIVKVHGGIAEVIEPLPTGVVVEVRDYDVPEVDDPDSGEAWPSDEDGDYSASEWGTE